MFRRFSNNISHDKSNYCIKGFDFKFKTKQNSFFYRRNYVGFSIWYFDFVGKNENNK